MQIINFHSHIYPSAIAEKATKSIGKFYNIPMDRIGTPEKLLQDTLLRCSLCGNHTKTGYYNK